MYLKEHPNLSSDKIVAMRVGTVINGMTEKEVKLVLGEPSFIEKFPKKIHTRRWIYRKLGGRTTQEAYNHKSSFPLGIGFVIPLHYKCKEMRIDFENGIVSKVEKILSF